MDQIVEIIKKKIADLGGNQSEVARQVGISSQLLGKYLNGSEPGISFAIAWKNAFDESLLSDYTETIVSRETVRGNHPHTEKLIQVLENRIVEEKRILEKHNDFLQDMMRSNLAGLKANQNLGAGILVELLQRDVDREVKGNPEKRKRILDEIVRRIGPDFDLVTGMGTLTHDGNADIH